MFHNRPCGCKGLRSCLVCEKQHGAWNTSKNISDNEKSRFESLSFGANILTAEDILSPDCQLAETVLQSSCYFYCPLCDLAWPGWERDSWKEHPAHSGEPISFKGIKVILDFVSEEEERILLQRLDEVPWDSSQSGRLKQNYGPKCNFKKHKVKVDGFTGYPLFTKFIQDRFQEVPLLKDFRTVEQCSLDYRTGRGSSIDFHIDDCWIWGERIPTLSLASDSVLTLMRHDGLVRCDGNLKRFDGSHPRYNLPDVDKYPAVVDGSGNCRDVALLGEFYAGNRSLKYEFPLTSNELTDEVKRKMPYLVRIPMPRRSLIVLYGDGRYTYEHSVLREDVLGRRVCVTYRELTPTFRECGPEGQMGHQILDVAKNFVDHRVMYGL